jgi:hypothetical protein
MMRHRQWIARLAVMTIVGVAWTAAGTALAASRVQGDAAAFEEIVAAFRKLNMLPGYRLKVAMPDGSSFEAEVAPPDSSHLTVQTGGGGVIDSYFVGNTSATKMSGPGVPGGGQCWRNSDSRPGPFFRDPTEWSGDIMTVSRRPDTDIDGTPVHDYVYTFTIGIAPRESRSSGEVFLETHSGLPRRVLVTSGGAFDYYDYGANITITLPC